MFIPKCLLWCVFILTIVLDPITGKRSFAGRHSYPKSGGLSGGGHSGGGGLSGGGHGYPSPPGRSHSYSQSHANYPQPGHNYHPPGGSHPQSHAYPPSHGMSGGSHGLSSKPVSYSNYQYRPPSQITYASHHGAPPVSYPVYHGTPPTYVYQYKDSGSKYGTLLAGLALMNLGTLGVAAYAAHKSSQGSHSTYQPQPNEVCKFAIKKENGDYEETRIDCQIISSFILQDMEATHNTATGTNNTVTTTTVTNTTTVHLPAEGSNQTSAAPNVLYVMQPNGTLVPVNVTGVDIPGLPGAIVNTTQNGTAPNTENNSVTTVITNVTTTTTNVPSALDVKGKPVDVTPGMQCFVMRHTPFTHMKKSIPCGVLQTYAEKSIQRNSASRNVPFFTFLILLSHRIW